jgi:hypothetical protein
VLLNAYSRITTHDEQSIKSCSTLLTVQVLEETGLTVRNIRFERLENCVHRKDGAIVAHYVTIFMRGEVDQVGITLPGSVPINSHDVPDVGYWKFVAMTGP